VRRVDLPKDVFAGHKISRQTARARNSRSIDAAEPRPILVSRRAVSDCRDNQQRANPNPLGEVDHCRALLKSDVPNRSQEGSHFSPPASRRQAMVCDNFFAAIMSAAGS
jgi:hypothetical protein